MRTDIRDRAPLAIIDVGADLGATGSGVQLSIQVTSANREDSQQAITLVDAIPFLSGERGRPRNRPDCVIGEGGYDAEAIPQSLRFRGIRPMVVKRNTEHGSLLPSSSAW